MRQAWFEETDSAGRATIPTMKPNQKRKAPSLPYAWGDLQANARGIDMLEPEANRLAFADPEFLLRRETRGIRFQTKKL